jgi:branched-chain amino acid transport system permease protein
MIGAYGAALAALATGSFWLGFLVGLVAAFLCGVVIEYVVMRRLYGRDHLVHVLASFGLILFFNGLLSWGVGRAPVLMNGPELLNGFIYVMADLPYPLYRLGVMAVGLVVALSQWWMLARTRLGMLIRAGSLQRDMLGALGVNVAHLFTLVFALGALLAGVAGVMMGPIRSVQIGMGEQILILTFVVIVVGGVGSVRGALVGAVLVGLIDTLGRAFVPAVLKIWLSNATADGVGAAIGSILIYLIMAVVLIVRPRGLFPIEEG